MAEAAGLVLGGVAITSLFTACIEILEYFENGRNWVCDLGMAFAKVNLMKVRLSQLQDDWLNTAVGGWHKKEWPGEKVSGFAGQAWEVATISQGLLGIDDVLRRTSKLCCRYSYLKCHTDTANHTRACHTSWLDPAAGARRRYCSLSPNSLNGGGDPIINRQASGHLTPWSLLGRKMCWAVQDKKKFDSLILDFEFLLSNLEKVLDKQPKPLEACTSSSRLKKNSGKSNFAVYAFPRLRTDKYRSCVTGVRFYSLP